MTGTVTRVLFGVALLFSVLIAFGMRFLNEDLFVALVAGRDIIEGRPAHPDTWSFMTGGKVWVNQGWLSHFLFYLSYKLLQDLGPVLLKGLLLLTTLALLYRKCRRLNVSGEVALLALSIGTLSVAPFLQIRAENFGLLYFVALTTFLAAPDSWGRVRYVGVLVTMLIWCNSHGSFVLGFLLIGLKAILESLRHFDFLQVARLGEESEWTGSGDNTTLRPLGSATAWFMTLAACLLVAVFANPYGPANLFMPHRQLSAATVTAQSADWAPLLDWTSLSQRGFFHPLDVRPYLVTVFVTAMLAFLFLAKAGVTGIAATQKRTDADLLLEILIPFIVAPLSFPFRRVILFAGVSVIPLLALLIQHFVRQMGDKPGATDAEERSALWRTLAAPVAFCCLVLTGAIFVRTTLPPYLPGNPTRPDRPLVAQLMSFDSYDMGIVDFLRKSQLTGRFFSDWVISDFLLFHVPDIKVFMDCRDQSVYSDETIETYFSVLNTDAREPGAMERGLNVLDRSKASTVILETRPKGFNLATLLMTSKKWACVFKNNEVFVLVRANSERFGQDLQSGTLPPLWYPDERIRISTSAVLSFFMTGGISPETKATLQKLVKERPDPNMYALLSMSGRDVSGCLERQTKFYLLDEMKRLSLISPLIPHVGKAVLESRIRILALLQKDEQSCSAEKGALPFGDIKENLEERLKELNARYLGYTP